jgi:hypothetical protein
MEMRTAAEWLNPVKVGGMVTYLVASASCGLTAARTLNPRISRLAAVLGLIQAALLLDIAFDWRWRLYDWLRSQAVAYHWYEQRRWPQVVVLMIMAVVLASGVVVARRVFLPNPGAALAVNGTLLSIDCWLMEVISLHATDSILYHHVGPLMIISFVWLLAGAMVTTGILRAGFGRAETAGSAGIVGAPTDRDGA